MLKAPPKTRDFDWKGTVQTDYLGVPLMHFGETHGARRPGARCCFAHTKFVSSVGGNEVRCAHGVAQIVRIESPQLSRGTGNAIAKALVKEARREEFRIGETNDVEGLTERLHSSIREFGREIGGLPLAACRKNCHRRLLKRYLAS
jgi:hypothetical protein